MKKWFGVIVAFIVLAVLFVGCDMATSTEKHPLSKMDCETIGYDDYGNYYRVFVDPDTGVNYIIVKNNNHWDIAITPRLNADGTVMVSEG